MELAVLRESGRINSAAMAAAAAALVPGISTLEVCEVARRVVERAGAHSALPEVGFPGFLCVSVNNQVGHAVPGSYCLCVGDVVKIDLAIQYKGAYTDAARTYGVGGRQTNLTGRVQGLGEHMAFVGRTAVAAGVQALCPNRPLSDASFAMGDVVARAGFTVVRHAMGHGTGTALHTWPIVPSFGPAGKGPRVRQGFVLALEPVLTAGNGSVRKLPDGWTEVTADGSLSAHWEDTVWVGQDGAVVVTDESIAGAAALTGGLDCQASQGSQEIILKGGWRIHWMGLEDTGEVLKLAQSQMNSTLIEAWGRRVDPKEVLAGEGTCTQVVRDAAGALAGFLTFSVLETRSVLHIHTLVLSPHWQGSGLAHQLLQELEHRALCRGLLRLELWVQTNNFRAQRFYAREGFVETGGPYLHSIKMYKILHSNYTEPLCTTPGERPKEDMLH
ncbi:type I methionyl aminopeptidase [Alicyclobacillaceae bacterium I2511]|nr:type I methionyl aminopeptidase [Alicyclobacillaceae bacterium I2511]